MNTDENLIVARVADGSIEHPDYVAVRVHADGRVVRVDRSRAIRKDPRIHWNVHDVARRLHGTHVEFEGAPRLVAWAWLEADAVLAVLKFAP